jgi:hypothetical protein
MSDSVANLGGLKLIDLSVPLEDVAVSGLVPCGGVGVRGSGVTRASRRLR